MHGLTAGEFATAAAYFLSELNAIHLFREGNGRAQSAFLAMLAADAGHALDFDRLNPETWIQAMIESFYKGGEALAAEILNLIADE